jgi:triosephosphate isomerase
MAHQGAPYVIGNWKMRCTLAESVALARAVAAGVASCGATVVVCPSFPHLVSVAGAMSDTALLLGAQDLSDESSGPFTGEVSAASLVEVGCRYVIVGHAERRQRCGEGDELIGRKVAVALRHGLTPSVCVGETREERQRGGSSSVVHRQLTGALAAVTTEPVNLVVAYEPVWALSPYPAASGSEARAMLAVVRQSLAERFPGSFSWPVIYGGDVQRGNVADFVGANGFQGVLVGAASVAAPSFLDIIERAVSAAPR